MGSVFVRYPNGTEAALTWWQRGWRCWSKLSLQLALGTGEQRNRVMVWQRWAVLREGLQMGTEACAHLELQEGGSGSERALASVLSRCAVSHAGNTWNTFQRINNHRKSIQKYCKSGLAQGDKHKVTSGDKHIFCYFYSAHHFLFISGSLSEYSE